MNKDLKKTISTIEKFFDLAGIPSTKKFPKRNIILTAGLLRTKGEKITAKDKRQ